MHIRIHWMRWTRAPVRKNAHIDSQDETDADTTKKDKGSCDWLPVRLPDILLN